MNDSGTVFQISASGVLTNLCSFSGGTNGADPEAGLVEARDGNLYGTTSEGGATGTLSGGYGTVFQINPDGTLSNLYSFTLGTYGAFPQAGLAPGTDGYYYGTTYAGGAYDFNSQGFGTVFQISTGGALTSLYSFIGTNDGANPEAGLALGSDGYFYGTTEAGGAYTDQNGEGYGTVFKISTNGTLTSLYSFTGGNDGAYPYAGLVQGSDGSFYGTTEGGGQGGAGTVFRLTVGPAAPVFQAVTLNDGTLTLTWSTEAGGMYQLQYNSGLGSSGWNNLGSPIPATGATLSVNETVANGPPRFYRVELLP